MTTTISCKYTVCEYVAEHSSEAVAIAMLTWHNNIHSGASNRAVTKQKVPKIERYTGQSWSKTSVMKIGKLSRQNGADLSAEMSHNEIADQLFQWCERSLARLLLKEDPKIIESGEDALLDVMRKMAVLQ